MGSASAKWAIMAPVFVPMFMLLGYSPEFTQAAYRVGDSVTNIISPMMSYFALIVAFMQRYDRRRGHRHADRDDAALLNGVIVRGGRIVAEWGDTARADMTFSVTKTFLSTVVGLAWQRGLIQDVHDRVGPYMPDDTLFGAAHNRSITWDHLLRQTSDWQGTLWDKPDWADRPEGERPADYPNRRRSAPGTRYKYNDVRVNVLALAALHVWRRPLPEVLRREVMDPIGASSTWRWYGYENSWIELDGRRIQSVSGGGHWGGGMFINARDMARFGLLFLRNGRWGEREIVPPKWIEMARTPGSANPEYGYMNWFLNTGRKPMPAAPASSVMFAGNGQNIVYVDSENDLVIVVRWIRGGPVLNDFVGKVLSALRIPSTHLELN
jgi:CubicO group peptidase (beta-lactamase class C family)